MRCLLDTHALIWWWLEDAKLSERARAALANASHQIFVSPVSAMEIAMKLDRNQLPELTEPLEIYEQAITEDRFLHLPINYAHARKAGFLEGRHGDPFDRLLAAQSLTENLVLITRDRKIAALGCKTLW